MAETMLTVIEAAARTGKSRDTIYRHIEDGILSARSHPTKKRGKLIDVQELIRVYGHIEPDPNENRTSENMSESGKIVTHNASEKRKADNALEVEVKMLRELLAEKNTRLQEKDEQIDAAAVREQQLMRQIGELTSTVKLIEDKTSKRKGWWPWSK